MNTSVLLSSMRFMADSVVSGYLITAKWSMRHWVTTDFRGTLGARVCLRVLGRWNEVVFHTRRSPLWPPCLTFLAAALA